MRILTVNAGSSSLKYAIYECDAKGERQLLSENVAAEGRAAAAGMIGAIVAGVVREHGVTAVAHRIVFGGPRYVRTVRATPQVLRDLRALAPYDPLHLPAELDAVDALAASAPDLAQTLSFDTAFHRTLPSVARLLPVPAGTDPIVQRYGFHGLSYEYVAWALGARARGRTIVAHLGSGASMTALRDGASIETTMGFTPLGGLVMATRPGDLDPGVVLHLLGARGNDAARLEHDLYYESGLRGLSGVSGDMRTLCSTMEHDVGAARAVGLFCFVARKQVGALAAALGGIDRLVFTGGIGEHAAAVRSLICLGLEHLGIELDPAANDADAETISTPGARTRVLVIPTNEELVLARHAYALLSSDSHALPG